MLRVLVLAALLSGCAAHEGLRPFTTDGCSLFPDRALVGSKDWCECCVEHDRAYWKGGTEGERLAADERFRECVAHATGDRKLAETMFAGVRVGGTPHLGTSFRWGYGWPHERNYQPLTDEEKALVAELEIRSRSEGGGDFCKK